jgi:hypothetical protein
MIQFKKTNKSFYGKWLYKISLKLAGSSVIRHRTTEDLVKLFNNNENQKLAINSLLFKAINNKDQILKLSNFLEKFDKQTYTVRHETDIFDFYTNNLDSFNELMLEFNNVVRLVCSPESGAEESLLQQKKNIIVKKYPHDRYRYRVFLLPHKITDTKEKLHFLQWINAQNERIRLTTAVYDWFLNTRWNWDRRYVLVEDQNTLLMLKLKNSEAVGGIYDYVIADK